MAGASIRNVLRRGGIWASSQRQATPDQELVARFLRDQDEGAFAALMERHGAMVLGVCQRVLRNAQDAEDACQAVFLVLARKAGSLRKQESLGSWLHGIAWRVSRKLQRSLARRGTHERSAAADRPAASEPADLTWNEVRRLVDEELDRLSAAYRAPIVLCHLEGRTQDEAARELGWSLGTLRGRLERGREKLRQRLVRRGVTASAALGLAALAPAFGSAAVPPTLVVATVAASKAAATGSALPASIPVGVAELARTTAWEAIVTPLSVGVMLAAAALIAGLAMFFVQPPTTEVAPPHARSKVVETWSPGEPLATGQAHLWCVAFSPDGKRLAVGSGGVIPTPGQLRVHDVDTGETVYAVDTPRSVRAVAFSPDGNTIATAEHDAAARIREAATGKLLQTFEGHTANIDTVAFSPDGKSLATSSWDHTVRLWNVETGQMQRALVGHQSGVFATAFGSNDTLATGAADGTAMIWSIATGQPRWTLKGHRGAVHWIAFSPDGRTLATASWDKTVRLWDVVSGTPRGTLRGHSDKVLVVAFAPDGKTLASGSGSWANREVTVPVPGEVIVWDVATRRPLSRLTCPDRIFGVAYAPDGSTLASASWDGAVRLNKRSETHVATPAGGAVDVPQRERYPHEQRERLRDAKVPAGWVRFGPDADRCVVPEAEGIRIQLPVGYPGQRPGTGLLSSFGIKGDFEVTVGFEIVGEVGAVEQGKAIDLSLVVVPREPSVPDVWRKANQNRALLSRLGDSSEEGGRFIAAVTKWSEETPKDKWGNEILSDKEKIVSRELAATSRRGKLRLVRTGTQLAFLVAEGEAADFTLLEALEFGDKEVKNVRVLGATGGAASGLEVRLHDLSVRADALTSVSAPSVAPSRGHGSLLMVVAALVVAVAGCLVFWYLRRSSAKSVEKMAAFRCPDCGKSLKARSDLAGKRVKCPHCQAAAVVPEHRVSSENAASQEDHP